MNIFKKCKSTKNYKAITCVSLTKIYVDVFNSQKL